MGGDIALPKALGTSFTRRDVWTCTHMCGLDQVPAPSSEFPGPWVLGRHEAVFFFIVGSLRGA